MEQNGTVMRWNSSVRMGDGTVEQGCAEAKLGEATLRYGRERRGVDAQWRRAEQTRIVKEINDGK